MRIDICYKHCVIPHMVKEIYIAVLFDIHPRFTYSLGTYLTEEDAMGRIKQYCNPFEMKQTSSPGQVSFHCVELECMVWVKKLIMGDAPDKTVILTNTAPQNSKGVGSTTEGTRLKVVHLELLPKILNSLKSGAFKQRLCYETYYVFPTSIINDNDIHSTALKNTKDIIGILNVDINRKIWIEIIELLVDIIRENGKNNVIDSSYHGQVDKFLSEWKEFKYRTVRKRWCDFTSIVCVFENIWFETVEG